MFIEKTRQHAFVQIWFVHVTCKSKKQWLVPVCLAGNINKKNSVHKKQVNYVRYTFDEYSLEYDQCLQTNIFWIQALF